MVLDRYFTAKTRLKAALPALRSMRSRAKGDAVQSTAHYLAAIEQFREVFRVAVAGGVGSGKSSFVDFVKSETDGRIRLDAVDITGKSESSMLTKPPLDQTDAIVCVIDATEPWAAEPWDFVRMVPRELYEKLLIVLLRSDLRSEVELQPVIVHIGEQLFQCTGRRFVAVPFSAKLARLANGGGLDSEGLRARSGIDRLSEALGSVLAASTGCLNSLRQAVSTGAAAVAALRKEMGEVALDVQESDAVYRGIEQLGESMLEQIPPRLSQVLTTVDRDIMECVVSAEQQLLAKSGTVSVADRAAAIQAGLKSGVSTAVERALIDAANRIEASLEKSWDHIGRHLRENHGEAVRDKDLKQATWSKARRPFLDASAEQLQAQEDALRVESDIAVQLKRPARARRNAVAAVVGLVVIGAVVAYLFLQWIPVVAGACVAAILIVAILYFRWKRAWRESSPRILWDALDPHREQIQQTMANVLNKNLPIYADEFRSRVKQLATEAERLRNTKEPVLSDFGQVEQAITEAGKMLAG
jgi:hypothetical protein